MNRGGRPRPRYALGYGLMHLRNGSLEFVLRFVVRRWSFYSMGSRVFLFCPQGQRKSKASGSEITFSLLNICGGLDGRSRVDVNLVGVSWSPRTFFPNVPLADRFRFPYKNKSLALCRVCGLKVSPISHASVPVRSASLFGRAPAYPCHQSKKAKLLLAASTLEQSRTLGMGESLSNGGIALTLKPNGDLELTDGNSVVSRNSVLDASGTGTRRGALTNVFFVVAVDSVCRPGRSSGCLEDAPSLFPTAPLMIWPCFLRGFTKTIRSFARYRPLD